MEHIRIETVETAERLATLKPEWDALLGELSEQGSVFMSHSWYDCWWRHFAVGKLSVLVARRGGDAVGIAPLMRRRLSLHGLPVRALAFLENGNSLHNDILAHPQYREGVYRALAEFCRREQDSWDLLHFYHLPADSPSCDGMARALSECGLAPRFVRSYDSPFLELNGGWDSFLAGRSQRVRKTLRNIRNTLERSGLAEVCQVTGWNAYLAEREAICRVAKNSWTERVGDSLAHPVNLAFFDELACRSAATGGLSLWLLRLEGRVIAFEFHLRGLGKQHALRASFDQEFGRLSPGAYLEAEILRRLFDEPAGVHRFDFGGSFDQYKRRWSDSSLNHVTLNAFHGGLYSRLTAFHENVVVKAGRGVRDRLRKNHVRS